MPPSDDTAKRAKWREDATAVFDKIIAAQQKAAEGFEPEVTPNTDALLEEGGVLLSSDGFTLDTTKVSGLLAETAGIIQDWIGGEPIRSDDTRLEDADVTALLKAAIEGGGALDERACDYSARPEVFAVAVRYALAPFVGTYAAKVRDVLNSDKNLGIRCPVCGAEPHMAELDKDDGHRELGCGLCGTHWRYARMQCPFCGAKDHEKLNVFEVESFDGYKIHACDECKRYIKSVDRRERTRPNSLELADVLTPELDEIAVDRKYGLRAKPEETSA